jgi:hypothetical protein
MIEQELMRVAAQLANSPRWDQPDSPGSADIVELAARVNDPDALRSFRQSAAGKFYLGVIESYEEAFNDDWLPFEIAALPLGAAREFISFLRAALEEEGAAGAFPKVKAHYLALREAEEAGQGREKDQKDHEEQRNA